MPPLAPKKQLTVQNIGVVLPLEATLEQHATKPFAPFDLDSIFQSYSGYVASIVLRLLGRESDVEDVVHDVFLAAMRGLKELRDPQAAKWWLKTVAVRTARRRLRQRRFLTFLSFEHEDDYQGLIASGPSPEDGVLLARVYQVLDGVRANERIAWTLHVVEGERLEDVAQLCGCSITTAKRRIAATRGQIRQALGDE